MKKTVRMAIALMLLSLVAAPSFALVGDARQGGNLYALEEEGVFEGEGVFENEGIIGDEDPGITEEDDWFVVALEDEGILERDSELFDEDRDVLDEDRGVFEENGTLYDDPGDEGVFDW